MFNVDNLMAGDPVRVAGHQGLWRFVDWVGESSVEVFGPYSPTGSNARKKQGSRIFLRSLLESPGRARREQVAPNPGLTQLSRDAQNWKKGRR